MIVLRTLLALVRLAAGRVAAAVRPVAGVVSTLGWIVLGLAVVSAVAGFVLGWPEFVYLALTLAAGLLVALLFLLGRASFRVEIELSPRRVVAGERAFGRMLVTNSGTRRSTATRLELPVGRGEAEFVIPALAPGAEQEELFSVPTARRAVIVAGPAVSVRGDQLGLLRRELRWADPVELFVHPVTTRLSPSAAGLVRDLEGEVTTTITNNDLAFHALRAYEPGDDRRYVHWRTSARTGQLMVRQFQETRRSQLVLLHSADESSYAGEAEFELAVSVTASIGTQVLREGTRVAIVSETLALRTATPTTLLDDSCRLEPVRSPHAGIRDFAREATRRLPPPSVVLFVTGSRLPVGELRAVETLFGADARTVGIRVEAGADPRLGVVSQLRVLTVGRLSDLPKLLTRIA